MSRRQLGITRWQLASNIRYDKMSTPKMTLKYLEQIGQRSEVQVVYSANFGNRFWSGDLLVLDTIVDTVEDTIQKIEKLGQARFDTSFKKPSGWLHKVSYWLFCLRQHKDKSRDQKQLKAMKLDRALFSTLYIVCQVRKISMTEFFSHENQPYPCSLSLLEYGSMRCGTKTDLLLCIEDQIIQGSVNRPDVQMIILDGAASIKPGASDLFNDYISTIMVYIRSQFSGEVVQVTDHWQCLWFKLM